MLNLPFSVYCKTGLTGNCEYHSRSNIICIHIPEERFCGRTAGLDAKTVPECKGTVFTLIPER